MTTGLLCMSAVFLDALWGEPRRAHPLVGFGRVARKLESVLYRDSRISGGFAVAVLLLPPTAAAAMLERLPGSWLFSVLALYWAIGWRSLGEHARRVHEALLADDLPAARRAVGHLVSRDPASLDATGVAGAAVESVLENGNDALFGALFWFALAGAPGVVLYRLANTLDAMWGYRNPRYRRFGWAAARFDDVMNLLPARLTALSYALAGNGRQALRCARAQGQTWKSPNAGLVMASGAGSLALTLGGAAAYHGTVEHRPALGDGPVPTAHDIPRALHLIRNALWIWLAVLVTGGSIAALLDNR